MPLSNDKQTCESFDAPFIAAIRCVLATSLLLVLTLDPLARTRFYQITYIALSIYVAYSTLRYVVAPCGHPFLPGPVEPWLDVGWAFYAANACVLIMADHGAAGFHLWRANRQGPKKAVHAEVIPEELAHELLAWPPHQAISYREQHRVWQRWYPEARVAAYDVSRGTPSVADHKLCEAVATTLDAGSYITVPLSYHHQMAGRLYLTAWQRRAFDASDVDFLLQVIEHTMSANHNIRLVDRLASDAAEAERQRIIHDLHDSVIQPYIGLQMGLVALRQKLAGGNAAVIDDLDRLLVLTKEEIGQLRRLIQEMKDGGKRARGLLPAIHRFAVKFAEATGITVHVEANSEPHVSDRLAAEIFQLVTEGLSNIRRHTQATRATISLSQNQDHLILQIANDGAAARAFVPFTRRSIVERAAALGGQARIERQGTQDTIVIITIPL